METAYVSVFLLSNHILKLMARDDKIVRRIDLVGLGIDEVRTRREQIQQSSCSKVIPFLFYLEVLSCRKKPFVAHLVLLARRLEVQQRLLDFHPDIALSL